jgi:hypothetical protein
MVLTYAVPCAMLVNMTIRSETPALYVVQYQDGDTWRLAEVELEGTDVLAVFRSADEASQAADEFRKLSPVPWRYVPYIVSGYGEERATPGYQTVWEPDKKTHGMTQTRMPREVEVIE